MKLADAFLGLIATITLVLLLCPVPVSSNAYIDFDYPGATYTFIYADEGQYTSGPVSLPGTR